MIINHNMNAMNSHRQMMGNVAKAGKSMEKLSSGLRINRAGDDAAGLAISEKMRAQVRGLDQASRNAQDGISLIQTAEGALNETHSILQRMRELSVQSANDTNVEVDRGEIQKEVDQLAAELTRIADDTEFNTQNLLGGEFEAKFHIGANKDQNITLDINAMDADSLKVTSESGIKFDVTKTATGDIGDYALKDGEYTIEELPEAKEIGKTGTLNAAKYVIKDGDDIVGASTDGKAWKMVKSANKGNEGSVNFTDAADVDLDSKVTSGNLTVKANGTTNFAVSGKASVKFAEGVDALDAGEYTVQGTGSDFTLQDSNENVVAKSTDGSNWTIDGTAAFTTSTLKADDKITVESGGIDVSTQESANNAIKTINDAIETVSTERSKLGAYQNRLEHTINNLNTSSENLQASESRIRDVDMANEMMTFSKNNILQQAAQAMLAQANQQPQGVLQLLR